MIEKTASLPTQPSRFPLWARQQAQRVLQQADWKITHAEEFITLALIQTRRAALTEAIETVLAQNIESPEVYAAFTALRALLSKEPEDRPNG